MLVGNRITPVEDLFSLFNPSTAKGGGGKITPRPIFWLPFSEPHGTIRNAFVTFPEYGWATNWHTYCIYIVTQKSKKAAANGGIFLKNLKKPITQVVCKIA